MDPNEFDAALADEADDDCKTAIFVEDESDGVDVKGICEQVGVEDEFEALVGGTVNNHETKFRN